MRELLSTALFAHSGQGLVRPYRPEVAAMLAAEHLDHLIAAGHPVQRVVADFVRTSFDRRVVGRAHGAMLAWLASMQPTVLRQLTEVAPELLIEDGDSQALALEDRVAALERHVAGAETLLPGNFHFQQADLRRFAEPDLETAVVGLLNTVQRGEGHFHLLQIAAAGRYPAAAPIMLQLCGDPYTPTAVRAYAMSALVACGTRGQLAECTRCLLAWGAPQFPASSHRFEREREDDVRHRLARHSYPGAVTAPDLLRLLGQIRGKEWSTNAKPLAAALAGAPTEDLGTLVTGLDHLCFPAGDGSRPHAAPPGSSRLPDLFRSLVTLVARAVAERPDLHPALVPIHGRCLRTIRHGRGHGYAPRERTTDLHDIPSAFRMAILDAHADGTASGPWHRVFEAILPTGGVDADLAAREAPLLLGRYAAAGAPGRRVYAEVLQIWIRNMTPRPGGAWSRRLRRAAAAHGASRDLETLTGMRWRPLARRLDAARRWRDDLPWRAEQGWTVGRQVARERTQNLLRLLCDLPSLANGRAVGTILQMLEAEGSDDLIVLDSATARRRRLGGLVVAGARAHAARHRPTGRRGEYVWTDILAIAGWGYVHQADPAAFAAMPDGDASRALLLALASPLAWPGWATQLAVARPPLWRKVVLGTIAREVAENRAADPRFTPHALGRIAELEPPLRAPVALDLVELASDGWLPSRAEVRSLRTIADADAVALDALRRLVGRRFREAVWEGSTTRVPEWLSLWMSWDPASVDELLRLREGPLSGDAGRSAMARSLDVLLSRDDPAGDRLVRLGAQQLRALASHLMAAFPPEDDDHREGMRRRDDQRIGEEARSAVLNLMGERHDAEGRAALEGFIAEHVTERDARWASAWLSRHSRDAAEPTPWTLDGIASYGAATARRPTSAGELLDAVVAGLQAVATDLASSEFDRRALFRDAVETDVRAFLGHELDRRHGGNYSITQETVTAREKRTDLRCELRTPGGPVAVVEIKLVHRWTWAQLLDKVVTQLLEQYLISDRVSHGAYVLVDLGRPPKGPPPPGGPADVEGLIEAIRDIVRTDARFEGRTVRTELLRIDVPPHPSRRAGGGGRGCRKSSTMTGGGTPAAGPDPKESEA